MDSTQAAGSRLGVFLLCWTSIIHSENVSAFVHFTSSFAYITFPCTGNPLYRMDLKEKLHFRYSGGRNCTALTSYPTYIHPTIRDTTHPTVMSSYLYISTVKILFSIHIKLFMRPYTDQLPHLPAVHRDYLPQNDEMHHETYRIISSLSCAPYWVSVTLALAQSGIRLMYNAR